MEAEGIDPHAPVDLDAEREETAPDPRDHELAAQNREEAIERVTENADAAWLEHAYYAALHCIATTYGDFTNTDEWWARLARLEVEPPHEPRAMAAITRRLKAEGWIEKTDNFIQSALPQAHSRNVQVWKILKRPES
jgi:hypothetical protein